MVAVLRKSFNELYRIICDLPGSKRWEILTEGELRIGVGRPGKKE
jgi:hypothetical protein